MGRKKDSTLTAEKKKFIIASYLHGDLVWKKKVKAPKRDQEIEYYVVKSFIKYWTGSVYGTTMMFINKPKFKELYKDYIDKKYKGKADAGRLLIDNKIKFCANIHTKIMTKGGIFSRPSKHFNTKPLVLPKESEESFGELMDSLKGRRKK